VLLSIEQYEALSGPSSSIVELLAMDTADRVRFTAPRLRKLTRPAELD
jgi:hypothetical protein